MKKSLISFAETLLAGVGLSVLIMLFVGQSLEIVGDSMYPTLTDGERIIAEKVSYKSREPQSGEIIIFRSLQNQQVFLIKRVVATAGQTIQPSEDQDLGLLADYVNIPVPAGYLAVMGDNRPESYDSRMFGLVPLENVIGQAFVVYWPLSAIRELRH
ncbi:signal peptidase I [Patescibacteria group bacterium]|nr:signal peptidase I [Patescibacteria group bacterium]